MANMKDIKNRIKSVSSTMQITKAMELVASSKLRRARERADNAKPYFNAINNAINEAVGQNKNSIYTKNNNVDKKAFIVIAGDRGLAGGYNSNVLKLAKSMIQENSIVIAVGKKSADYFKNSPKKYIAISENLSMKDCSEMADYIFEDYKNGKISEIHICYTELVSPLVQEPKSIRLLPLTYEKNSEKISLTEYDPSPEDVLENIMPIYMSGVIYGAIVDSYASEQASRRIAMENASENASDMIDDLSLLYNRARQGAITQELSEIVAGANNEN